MSVDRNLHIGPYAECVYLTRTRDEEREGCSVHRDRFARGKFCPDCGAQLGKYMVSVPDRPDVVDLTSENLTTAEVSGLADRAFLIANIRRKGAPKYIETDAEFAEDVRARDMTAECAWFEKAFARELDRIRPEFASVEIKWGVLQWFS